MHSKMYAFVVKGVHLFFVATSSINRLTLMGIGENRLLLSPNIWMVMRSKGMFLSSLPLVSLVFHNACDLMAPVCDSTNVRVWNL